MTPLTNIVRRSRCSVSAAGQAITTYIRNHMQRCEDQEDHPLLLRHILSGTSADDELLPALHSRTGGAHCTANSEERLTNFRRGTMVWYLSRATGAPCPFTRAGIQLCQYGENGKVGSPNGTREKKRERDRQRRAEQCGQKRKRVLRGHKGSECESAEERGKPPKVKLTLRLRPCAALRSSPSGSQSSGSTNVIDLSKDSDADDSQDDSMSVDSSSDEEEMPQKADAPWSLPPYPKRSISIPCYTPSIEMFPSFSTASPSVSASSPINGFRRSPSVPYSVASPPPDSEDEDDDYHISMTGSRHFPTNMVRTLAREADPDWDLEFDSDEDHGETETQWESPGPRSPSAPLATFGNDILVKQEPRDVEGVQGMLDHWEPLDSNIDSNKVVEVVAKAAAGFYDEPSPMGKIKVEELECWDWEETYGSGSPDWYRPSEDTGGSPHIKQEDFDFDDVLVSGDDIVMSPAGEDDYVPSSPLFPFSGLPHQSSPVLSVSAPNISGLRRHSELTWKDVELLGPDSVHPHEFEDGEWQQGSGSATIRARAKTQPSLPTFEATRNFSSFLSTQQPPSSAQSIASFEPDDIIRSSNAPSIVLPPPSSTAETHKSSTPPGAPVASPSTPPTPPEKTEIHNIVVVHTCQPCASVISATQVEGEFSSIREHNSNLLKHHFIGISVYQMALGSLPLFRRIDTDFVNLSPIITHLGLTSDPLSPNAILVNQGSAIVCGTWVPLASAQAFVREHPLPDNPLETFLSDVLFERFPSALQDFHRSNAPGRLLNQFGPHFQSTVEAKRRSRTALRNEVEFRGAGELWEMGSMSDWDVEDQLLSSHPPFSLGLVNLRRPPEEELVPETPLSPTEQEMFYALCSAPDWENFLPSPTMCNEEAKSRNAEEDAEDDSPARARDQPRRRSKRVANANAIATRTRTRSQKRGSRNSLS